MRGDGSTSSGRRRPPARRAGPAYRRPSPRAPRAADVRRRSSAPCGRPRARPHRPRRARGLPPLAPWSQRSSRRRRRRRQARRGRCRPTSLPRRKVYRQRPAKNRRYVRTSRIDVLITLTPQAAPGMRCLAVTNGAVAKWLGNGLQNRHTSVRIRSAPLRSPSPCSQPDAVEEQVLLRSSEPMTTCRRSGAAAHRELALLAHVRSVRRSSALHPGRFATARAPRCSPFRAGSSEVVRGTRCAERARHELLVPCPRDRSGRRDHRAS